MHAYLAVLVLLLSPEEIPVSPHQPPEMWAALQEFALAAEIVGPGERWAVQSFDSEVRYVRNYLHQLPDAPPLADAGLLPPRDVARDCCRFNLECQERLEAEQMLCPARADRYAATLTECRRLHHAWSAAAKATDPGRGWAQRRLALAELREAIGPEAYYAGEWPAAVPLRAFREVDK